MMATETPARKTKAAPRPMISRISNSCLLPDEAQVLEGVGPVEDDDRRHDEECERDRQVTGGAKVHHHREHEPGRAQAKGPLGDVGRADEDVLGFADGRVGRGVAFGHPSGPRSGSCAATLWWSSPGRRSSCATPGTSAGR